MNYEEREKLVMECAETITRVTKYEAEGDVFKAMALMASKEYKVFLRKMKKVLKQMKLDLKEHLGHANYQQWERYYMRSAFSDEVAEMLVKAGPAAVQLCQVIEIQTIDIQLYTDQRKIAKEALGIMGDLGVSPDELAQKLADMKEAAPFN